MDYWIFHLCHNDPCLRYAVETFFPHSEVEVMVFWSFLLPESSAQDGLDEFINIVWRQRRDVCTLSTIATWRKFRSLYKYEDHINFIHSKVTSYGFRSSLMYALTLRKTTADMVLHCSIEQSYPGLNKDRSIICNGVGWRMRCEQLNDPRWHRGHGDH